MLTKPLLYRRHSLALAVAGLMAAAIPQVSLAQSALEEIIVTAQKRAENVQDTPIAMSALSTAMLENQGLQNVGDLIGNVPGISGFEAIGSRGNIAVNIRGVSSGNPGSPSIDPAAGMYIDGVYIGKTAGSAIDVAELERIEVLRGPQGTLYGRNSTAGAINFITKKPTGELRVKATGTVGNYDLTGYKVSLDLPSIGTEGSGLGTLATNFSIQGRDRDPLYDNTNPAHEGFESINRSAYRFAARWQPSDTVTVDYAYDYSDLDENTSLVKVVGFAPLSVNAGTQGFPRNVGIYNAGRGAALLGNPAVMSNPTLAAWANRFAEFENSVLTGGKGRPNRGSGDVDSTSATEHDGHTLTLAWEAGELGALGEVEFKSITAYREMENDLMSDIDGIDNAFNGAGIIPDTVISAIAGLNSLPSIVPGSSVGQLLIDDILANGGSAHFVQGSSIAYEQFSQEFQMNGSTDQTDYTIGLYYFEDKSQYNNWRSPLFPIAFSDSTNYKNSTEAAAVFGQVTWTPPILDDRLSLTFGLRYTEETKDVTYQWRDGQRFALTQYITGAYAPFLPGAGTATGTPAGNYVPMSQAGSMAPVPGIYGMKGEENFYNTSGKLTVAYQALDNANVFFTYSTGYRSGGFNGDFVDVIDAANGVYAPNDFAEELMEQIEIGVKSDWWDNRLRVNSSLYTYEYDDLQVSLIKATPKGTPASGIENGGMAKRWGFELEVQVAPVEDLLVGVSYNYLNGDFDEYDNACAPVAQPGALNRCITTMAKDGRRAQSPSNIVQLSVDYTVARWDAASLKLHMDGTWSNAVAPISHAVGTYDTTGDRVADSTVLFEQPQIDERTIINGRLTLDDMKVAGGVLRMGLWGKNLFDQDYRTFSVNYGQSIGLVAAQYGEPRTYGLDVTWEY